MKEQPQPVPAAGLDISKLDHLFQQNHLKGDYPAYEPDLMEIAPGRGRNSTEAEIQVLHKLIIKMRKQVYNNG